MPAGAWARVSSAPTAAASPATTSWCPPTSCSVATSCSAAGASSTTSSRCRPEGESTRGGAGTPDRADGVVAFAVLVPAALLGRPDGDHEVGVGPAGRYLD